MQLTFRLFMIFHMPFMHMLHISHEPVRSSVQTLDETRLKSQTSRKTAQQFGCGWSKAHVWSCLVLYVLHQTQCNNRHNKLVVADNFRNCAVVLCCFPSSTSLSWLEDFEKSFQSLARRSARGPSTSALAKWPNGQEWPRMAKNGQAWPNQV